MGAKTSIIILILLSVTLGVVQMGDRVSFVSDDRVIRLNFWNGFTGPDGRTMLRIIREFNESHPDIEVTMQRMEWAIYFNKLMVAGIDGRGPQVFVLHASELPRFQRAGFIAPIDEVYGEPDGLPIDDFDPDLLKHLRYDGKMVGVPMDIHPQGMYLNAEMLREAGIVDEDGHARPPTNRQEFMEAVKAMRLDPNHDGRPDQWGFALTMWRNNFISLMPQFGGSYFDEQGRCALDSPENVAALEFLVSLGGDDPLVPAPENNLGWVGYRQKKVAMVFDGIYMLGDLKRLEGLEYIAAPIPQIGPYPGTHGDSHVLCVAAGLDPAERAAAEAFVKFISNHGIEWADAGQVPARISARTSDAFRDMPVQYAFSHQVPYVMYPPRSPAVFELQQQIDFAVEKALRGRVTPEEALRTARENFEDFVAKAGLPMLVDEVGR